MNKIFKIIFCFQFFILGCAPNAIEDNKVILKKIESLNMNIFSKGKSHLKQQGDLFINELVTEKKIKLEYFWS